MATAPALIPDAAVYGQEQAYAQQAYSKAKSNIQSQESSWLHQYGMTGNFDPNSDTYSNFKIDPYNQYGLVQQNRTSEALGLQGAQADSAARHLGGSGLANQSTSALQYQYGVQDSQLGDQFTQGMTGFGQNLQDAADSYQQAIFKAQMDALQAALMNGEFQAYNPGDTSGSSSTSTASALAAALASGAANRTGTSGKTSTANTGVMRLPTTKVYGGKI